MYTEQFLRLLALGCEPLRPLPIPGWVHNGHWIARSDVAATGRPVESLTVLSANQYIAGCLEAHQEPLTEVGSVMRPAYRGEEPSVMCVLFESAEGVVAVQETYAQLLEGLTPALLCIDARERCPVGGVDQDGELQCWIMQMQLQS